MAVAATAQCDQRRDIQVADLRCWVVDLATQFHPRERQEDVAHPCAIVRVVIAVLSPLVTQIVEELVHFNLDEWLPVVGWIVGDPIEHAQHAGGDVALDLAGDRRR